MLMTFSVLIIVITIPIVQIALCKNLQINSAPMTIHVDSTEDTVRVNKRFVNIKKDKVSKIAADLQNEAKYFESIIENNPTSSVATPVKTFVTVKKRAKQDKNYNEIKQLLSKLLDRMKDFEKDKREEPHSFTRKSVPTSTLNNKAVPTTHQRALPTVSSKLVKKKKKDEGNRRQRWGHWTDWSSCSVSCGKGREIRWRHCVEDCDEAETEMEEKTCQLPACAPGKLFGIIKLG